MRWHYTSDVRKTGLGVTLCHYEVFPFASSLLKQFRLHFDASPQFDSIRFDSLDYQTEGCIPSSLKFPSVGQYNLSPGLRLPAELELHPIHIATN